MQWYGRDPDLPISNMFKKRHSRASALITVISAIAFALLVSVAATHLHLSPAGDSDCEICSAVAGKLSSPPAVALAPAITFFVVFSVAAPVLIQVVRVAPTLLPPSCGPPLTA
jgi:hypothetical protein